MKNNWAVLPWPNLGQTGAKSRHFGLIQTNGRTTKNPALLVGKQGFKLVAGTGFSARGGSAPSAENWRPSGYERPTVFSRCLPLFLNGMCWLDLRKFCLTLFKAILGCRGIFCFPSVIRKFVIELFPWSKCG